MEGGNRLPTNVVGCLTPSPRITKSPNLSLVPNLVFYACLNQDNKTSRHRWPITPHNFPMIGGDSKSHVVRPHCHVYKHAKAHTHTHICTCLYNMITPAHNTLKSKISSSPMGVEVGKYKINPQSSKIDRRKDKTKINIFFLATTLISPISYWASGMLTPSSFSVSSYSSGSFNSLKWWKTRYF